MCDFKKSVEDVLKSLILIEITLGVYFNASNHFDTNFEHNTSSVVPNLQTEYNQAKKKKKIEQHECALH